jgi:hypothetical protein
LFAVFYASILCGMPLIARSSGFPARMALTPHTRAAAMMAATKRAIGGISSPNGISTFFQITQ